MIRFISAIAFAALFLPPAALAGQPKCAGGMRWIEPPQDITTGRLEDNKAILIFAEQQGVMLPESIKADITRAGAYPAAPMGNGPNPKAKRAVTPVALSEGSIPDGTTVDSYLLHFDPLAAGGAAKPVSGSVSFNAKVLGIIIKADSLRATDKLLSAPETTYPSGDASDLVFEGGTKVKLGDTRRMVSVTLAPTRAAVNIRVITAAAKPAKGAAVGRGGNDGGGAEGRSAEGDAEEVAKPRRAKRRQRQEEQPENPPPGDVLAAPSIWSGMRAITNRSDMKNCQIRVEPLGGHYRFTYTENHSRIRLTLIFSVGANNGMTLLDWKNNSVGNISIDNVKAEGSTNGQGMQIWYSWTESTQHYQRAFMTGSIEVTRDR